MNDAAHKISLLATYVRTSTHPADRWRYSNACDHHSAYAEPSSSLRDWPDTHCGTIYCTLGLPAESALGLQQASQDCNRWRHIAGLASPLRMICALLQIIFIKTTTEGSTSQIFTCPVMCRPLMCPLVAEFETKEDNWVAFARDD